MNRSLVWIALLATFLLTGCGLVGDDREPYPLATQVPVTNPGGMSAIVAGVLEVDLDRGCVWIAADGQRYPVLWPSGTSAELGPFEVTLADGSKARAGDTVSGAGGYVPVESLPAFAGCADDDEVAVFNPNAPVSVDPK